MTQQNATGKYIRVDGEPVEEPDVLVWGRWFETADRQVAFTRVGEGVTEANISTVFLALENITARARGDGAPPLLWQTIVFGGKLDQKMEMYATKVEALAGHENWVAQARGVADA